MGSQNTVVSVLWAAVDVYTPRGRHDRTGFSKWAFVHYERWMVGDFDIPNRKSLPT